MNHAFGIDLDASPQGQICVFHSSETVTQKIPHSSLAVAVQDETSRTFLREHFQQCLMSGFICKDVKDLVESCMDRIWRMKRQTLPKDGKLPNAGEWPRHEWWETETGAALKEWLLYKENMLNNRDYSDSDPDSNSD